MYHNCLFCTRALGSNQVVEYLPVGRRLAFDTTHGRLWVVCRKCERWNLVPLLERWEALEELERGYASLRVRYSTEHIGIARHPGGVDLVRVGRPRRPEMAAWRYGDQFGRRRRRRWVLGGLAAATGGSGVAIAATSAAAAPFLGGLALALGYAVLPILTVLPAGHTVVKLSDGRYQGLERGKARETRIVPSQEAPGWAIRVQRVVLPKEIGFRASDALQTLEFTGEDARIVASRIIPATNPWGAPSSVVRSAVRILDDQGDADAAVRSLVTDESRVGSLAHPQRLALEMALHEETERRALAGELTQLEAQWRAAEELAAISDSLLTPTDVERRLEALRRETDPTTPGGE